MTLGAWMKNYLYIPLGGNKVDSKRRLYFNLWLVFLVSGLWHGASWNFIIWGAYHGLFLVLERSFLQRFYTRIGKLPSTIITFFIVVVGWVFFRVEKLSDALVYIKRMFAFDFSHSRGFDSEFYTYFSIAVFFAFFAYFKNGQKIQDAIFIRDFSIQKHFIVLSISAILFLLCISSITAFGFNPFIYFRF